MKIKAQIMCQWYKTALDENDVLVNVSVGDSIMDVTGQDTVNIPPKKKLVTWELWTEDITPYEADPEIYVISWYEEVEDETP